MLLQFVLLFYGQSSGLHTVTGFQTLFYGYEIGYFLCFEHCTKHYLCPSYRLLYSFQFVRYPTYYLNNRVLDSISILSLHNISTILACYRLSKTK
jgi:hypothetical protein